MKISKSNKYTRSVALGLSLLVSTSLLSGCNDDRHLHVYEKQGVVKLIESENRVVDGYIKTEDTIPYDKGLDYELQVLDYYGLVRVNDNVSYIENSILENKPYIEYEYVYYEEDVKHYFDGNNIYINKIDNLESVPVDGFKRVVGYTKDENMVTYTGNQRLVKTKYKVYKIVADNFGNFYLIQNIVDNPLDTMEEYPYFKPNRFTILDYTDVTMDKIKIK